MRIAYLVHNYPPHGIAGTEVYAESLANAMVRRGHTVHVFYPGRIHERRTDEFGVRQWITARGKAQLGPVGAFWHSYRDPTIERDWKRFLSEVAPDLVHVQHLQNVSARLPLMTTQPIVATLHDYWYLCANGQLLRPDRTICDLMVRGTDCARCGLARAGLPDQSPLAHLGAPAFAQRNRVVRTALERFDHLISPSGFLRTVYVNQGVREDRFDVIENGMDLSRLAPCHPERHDGSRGDGRPLRLMFLGSIAWQKGVHTLIRAFNQVHQAGATLTLYGNLETFSEYATEVQQMARHPGITFAGPLDHRHIGDALRQADFLVVPSLWYENSPVVIQEAYTVGTPVIASDIGALPEKVIDGITGRLFPPGDSLALALTIDELAAQPHLRDSYHANLRPCPEIDEHAERIERIYASLVT